MYCLFIFESQQDYFQQRYLDGIPQKHYMSVYIKIKEARLPRIDNAGRLFLSISSSDNIIKTHSVLSASTISWNTCMISSIKQKKILFQIQDESSLQSFGRGELFFSSLRSHPPEKQFSDSITLDKGGQITIDVYYTERQNFIGEIAFYNYERIVPKKFEETNVETTKAESRRLFESTEKVGSPPSKGFFFCCGDEGDDKQYTVEEDLSRPIVNSSSPFSRQLASSPQSNPTEAVQFYKGPCKSTNMFSVCDAKLQDQKFTVIQDYYRDR